MAIARTLDTAKCQAARETFSDERGNAKRWELLLFAFGAALVAASIALIALVFFAEDKTGTRVSAIATVVSGGGVAFCLARARSANKRRDAAKTDVATYCGDAELMETLQAL